MRFIHISSEDSFGSQGQQSQYFSEACTTLGLEYVRIIDTKCTLRDYLALGDTSRDAVYRGALSKKAHSIEKAVVKSDTLTNYYDNNLVFTGKASSTDILKQNNLPYISDIPFLPVNKRDALEFPKQLGGFPLILKVMGGMEGVGVIKVDSIESFNSVSDYIKTDRKLTVRVMKYVEHKYFARVVVVGGEVVTSTTYMAPLGDFRANARGPREEEGGTYTPPVEVIRDSVTFVQKLGVKSAGVDVLLSDDAYYFAEANAPFNFAETQKMTGIDIARKMIEAIIK
ncbi:MAG: RimK family alpha-L-glutamate ligase [Candidatus Paceibacteria bacterium]